MNNIISVIVVLLAALSISSVMLAPSCSLKNDRVKLIKFGERIKVAQCSSFEKKNCKMKCILEKHGYFDSKGRFLPNGIKNYLKEVSNKTAKFRDVFASACQSCAKAADEDVEKLKKGENKGLDECTKYGLFSICVSKIAMKEMFRKMPEEC